MSITIDRAGRIVVPKALRERYSLHPGAELEIEAMADGILLRARGTAAAFIIKDAGEEVATTRHEYIGGTVHAMAGGTRDHSAIAANAIVSLGSQPRGKTCRPFTSDLKIRIDFPDHVRFYYPDASVVCTPASGDNRYEKNPTVVLEVLSESTRRIDQTEKRDGYFHLPSLQVLILADSESLHVLVHRRRPDGGFAQEEYRTLDAVVPLPEIGAELALGELYEGIGVDSFTA